MTSNNTPRVRQRVWVLGYLLEFPKSLCRRPHNWAAINFILAKCAQGTSTESDVAPLMRGHITDAFRCKRNAAAVTSSSSSSHHFLWC